jgi:hypothetical protein
LKNPILNSYFHSIATIIRGLRQTDDLLVTFTEKLRMKAPALDRLLELDETLVLWDTMLGGLQIQQQITVTVPNLREWFGEAMIELPVVVDDIGSASIVDLLRIIDYPSDFVPV